MRLALVIAFLCASTLARAQAGNAPGDHFERGRAAFEQRLYVDAAREFELSLQSGGHPAIWFNVGESYRRAGDSARALAAYRNYLAHDPNAPNRDEASRRIAELEAVAPPPHTPPPPTGYTPPPPAGYAPPPPAGYAPPPPMGYAPPGYVPPAMTEVPGWSLGAGIYGVIASTAVLGLAIGSEITRADQVPSIPLGGVATLIHIVSVPIVAAGGASVRGPMGVRGSLGLRVVGWVTYGVTIGNAIALIVLGTLDVSPPLGLITSTGLLGFTSGLTMSIDAFVSRGQAERRLSRPVTSRTVLPALGVAPDGRGALLTVGGAF